MFASQRLRACGAIFCLVLGAGAAGAATEVPRLPAGYTGWSAQAKLEELWNERVMPMVYATAPELVTRMPDLSRAFLRVSFDHDSDEMPEGREKLIHPFGAVGKVELVAEAGHPWTGLFRSGAIGLARLSLAGPPRYGKSFTPGLAVKLLVDGRASVNLHVMHALEGQVAWNYFEREFSNIIPPPESFLLRILAVKFSRAKADPNRLPVRALAGVDRSGASEAMPDAPAQLWFVPTPEVANRADKDTDEDFRTKLARIPAGTTLYTVFGAATEDGKRFRIGTLVLRSPIVASRWADERLFFRHQE